MRNLLSVMLLVSLPALAAPPAAFNARVESLRQSAGVPGMAIAIVENGKTSMAQGFGTRQLGNNTLVDGDTLFPIGSTTKGITAAALATLVDDGKIGWDDKVVKHLPNFQMYDPWVTREITIRDLLVHRSGLGPGGGDLLFVPRTNLSRAETVRRVRYLKPKTSFRSTFAYSNLMYVVAGELIEAVSGRNWEQYLLERVLRPAGMQRSTTDNAANFKVENRAFPHARMSGGLRGVGQQELLDERDDLGRNAAPGGGVASSANDLAQWLHVMLRAGMPATGPRIFSAQTHAAMLTPNMLLPVSVAPAELKETQAIFSAYGLGWNVTDYRGAKMIWHGGAVFGFKTAVVILPEHDVGFAITINSEDGELIRGLMYELADHYLKLPRRDWPAVFQAYRQKQLANGQRVWQSARTRPAAAAVGTPPPHITLAGTYADPWYGNIDIRAANDILRIEFTSTPRMGGRLEHWQGPTFITRFDDKTIEPAYVTFAFNPRGQVERITMKPASPVADFSWDYQDLSFAPIPGVSK